MNIRPITFESLADHLLTTDNAERFQTSTQCGDAIVYSRPINDGYYQHHQNVSIISIDGDTNFLIYS